MATFDTNPRLLIEQFARCGAQVQTIAVDTARVAHRLQPAAGADISAFSVIASVPTPRATDPASPSISPAKLECAALGRFVTALVYPASGHM